MPQTIIADSSNPNASAFSVYTLPSDGDINTAESINTPNINAYNTIAFLTKALGYYRPHVELSSSSSTSVTLNLLSVVFAWSSITGTYLPINSSTANVVLDHTFLDPPAGSFSASTWYYVYAYTNDTNPNFEISSTGPEADLMYKNDGGTYTMRYCGSFVTDGSGNIIPFQMIDFDYTFAFPLPTNFSSGAYTGGGAADVIMTNFSPYGRTVKTVQRLYNTSTTTQLLFTLGPKETAPNTFDTWTGYLVNAQAAAVTAMLTSEYPLYPSSLRLSVNIVVGTGDIFIWWNGFKE